MTKSPGQRSPWAENCLAAHPSNWTSISATVGSRTQRLDKRQLSSPTLDDAILAQRHREKPEQDLAVVGGESR